MYAGPPGFSAIVDGVTYGLRLALRKVNPNDATAHPSTPEAVAQAVWFRFMINALNGLIVIGIGGMSILIVFIFISLIDALLYPNISHAILARTSMRGKFLSFITAFTWVGNLRILLLMTVSLVGATFTQSNSLLILFPFAVWMIWASWSVATASLERGGWVGAGMVVLGFIVEMFIGAITISYLHPHLP